jgi:N-acetylneuraminate synthase
MVKFEIGNQLIGDDLPPLVIAEIGINHGGSLQTAKLMVDAASRAGAKVVKHQSHVVQDEMSPSARDLIPGNADVSIYELIKTCALSPDEEFELKRHVESHNMLFLSTPFSRAAADNLQNMGVLAFKIGSGECNNYPLVEHIARFNKPVILSTGMNSLESIRPAVEILRAHRLPFALLHCTNIYPTPPALVRLAAMGELKEAFPDAVVGLSDHTTGNYTSFAAVALGASIIERHFTDHMTRSGPDIRCSADEAAFGDLLNGCRDIFLARGGTKEPLVEERDTMNFAFATVVTIDPIRKGEVLTTENIWVKRPGTGEIPAKKFELIIGRTAAADLESGRHLNWSDLS